MCQCIRCGKINYDCGCRTTHSVTKDCKYCREVLGEYR